MIDPIDTDRFTGRRGRSFGRALSDAGLRILVFGAAFGTIVSLTLCAIGLAAMAGLLWVASRDITLSSRIVSFWPESLGVVHFHLESAWTYLLAAFALLFGALPMALALLEKLVLSSRRANRREKGGIS